MQRQCTQCNRDHWRDSPLCISCLDAAIEKVSIKKQFKDPLNNNSEVDIGYEHSEIDDACVRCKIVRGGYNADV